MELGALKPLVTTLVMPLSFLLLVVVAGLVLSYRSKRTGLLISSVAATSLWMLSSQAVAIWLAAQALPPFPPVTPAQLQANKVQAIVVLSGGILPEAPEYGQAQPGPATAARLRYGIWLAKQTGLPIAFTGGNGWAASSKQINSEAEVASRVAAQDYGMALRWVETQSRDTSENASLLAPMLKRDGISRIALVTDAVHMPRAVHEFGRHGLAISPAPTGFVRPTQLGVLMWLPSPEGLSTTTRVLHELLGLTIARLR